MMVLYVMDVVHLLSTVFVGSATIVPMLTCALHVTMVIVIISGIDFLALHCPVLPGMCVCGGRGGGG